MAENFTAKQKEIVARKLGYDGPMQGFDNFLNSSPALGMKYATLSDKFATRMAKGGIVRKKFAAGGDVASAWKQAETTGDYSKIGGMVAGMSPAEVQSKYGVSQADANYILSRPGVSTSTPVTTTTTVPTETTAAPVRTTTKATTDPVITAWKQAEATGDYSKISGLISGIPPADLKSKYGLSQSDINYINSRPGVSATKPATVITGPTTDPIIAAWKQAEATGDYSKISGLITGMSPADLKSKYGLSQSDINYINSRPGVGATKPAVLTGPTSDPVIAAWREAEATGDYSKIGGLISGMSPAEVQSKYGLSQADAAYLFSRPGVVSGAAAASSKAAQEAKIALEKELAAAKTEAERLAVQEKIDALNKGSVTTGGGVGVDAKGAPILGAAPSVTAAQTEIAPGMAPTAVAAGATQQAGVTQATAAAPVAAPTPITAQPITAASAAGGVGETLGTLTPQQGAVSEAAQITAATQAPSTTAVAGMEAAQGVAGTVQGAPTRTVQEGEMVAGPAVDMARAEETMAKTQAAQGVVTEEMTVQGQLNKLLTSFDAGNPPPWAAASMRAANAQMAARGLGASSMAGQAIIQATLEAATPIAAADAKVFETMGLQNLSNRQQVAVLVGQQRAAFLGQEFDQAFQTRVLNAARVADIANKNFDAQTQIAIENSRLANSMDIANLSAKNAVVLSKMAQMSQLETTNLNNRQQAAVENAKAFLTMDIKNLDNRQQTALFKAQEMNDALISDAGFSNAVNITNSQNALEAEKVSATLAQNAAQFNADMVTKVSMANALAANEIGKFNAQQANAREEFNSNMANQINIANAKVLAEISTANTAAVNAANAINAKNATDLSAAAYAQQSQTYRDLLEMSWKTGEAEKDRATTIAAATLGYNADVNSAKTTADSNAIGKIAGAGVALLSNYDSVSKAWTDFNKLFKD